MAGLPAQPAASPSLIRPRVGYDMPGQGKATMEFLVRMYAARLAARRLCVNAVSPGYTDTKEWDKARLAMGGGDMEVGRQRLDDKMLSRSPMKRRASPRPFATPPSVRVVSPAAPAARPRRWADADEIAQSIAFLCSEQSGLITGAVLPVDGGLHLT
jgi:3-oxoacyl-[acyl-carrier protein] reductase